MKLQDIYEIDSIDDFETKKSAFLSIKIFDYQNVKHTNIFLDYIKMYTQYGEHSSLQEILEKCKYTEQELKEYNLHSIVRTRRVSWDTNLVEIKEIEGRKSKHRRIEKVYDYDLQKIQNCDKEKVTKILNDLQNKKILN
ncbi:hypothetical protein NCER_100204 [Vairimorpha ceranae BRL01]|uniref:Uncharacterized protein n=1 Tax=Vairimorpha ceranae (strain BRL01) TaxID=578460 RepID=C4V6Z9_VAIC1|nr:hypothetical protein NCER_100204 [Vairimorpha ceranae BRL01]